MESVRKKDRLIAGGVAACLFLLLVALSYNGKATSKIETDETPKELEESVTSSISAETDLASTTDSTADATITEVRPSVKNHYLAKLNTKMVYETEPALTPTSSVASKSSKEKTKKKKKSKKAKKSQEYKWDGPVLNTFDGIVAGPSGNETYYNLDMSGVISIMQNAGYNYKYWVRDDGVKMYGDYVMVAADLSIRPRGSIVPTSLGLGIVCDTGGFVNWDSTRLDIATTW